MSRLRRRFVLLGALFVAACASSEAETPSAFDRSAGEAQVVIGPDGFGMLDGQRMPFEAIVVRLRHRTRGLGRDAMSQFVVSIQMQPDVADEAARRGMQNDLDRLMEQLRIMGVQQGEMRSGVGR